MRLFAFLFVFICGCVGRSDRMSEPCDHEDLSQVMCGELADQYCYRHGECGTLVDFGFCVLDHREWLGCDRISSESMSCYTHFDYCTDAVNESECGQLDSLPHECSAGFVNP